MLKNVLFVLFLLKGSMDFDQPCTNISLGDTKEVIRFWCLSPYFQGQRMLENILSAHYLLKG